MFKCSAINFRFSMHRWGWENILNQVLSLIWWSCGCGVVFPYARIVQTFAWPRVIPSRYRHCFEWPPEFKWRFWFVTAPAEGFPKELLPNSNHFIYITSPTFFTSPSSTSSTSHTSSASPTSRTISFTTSPTMSFASPTSSKSTSSTSPTSPAYIYIGQLHLQVLNVHISPTKLLQCHLHRGSYTGVVTQDFLHRSSYTGVLTQEFLHRRSYTGVLSQRLLHRSSSQELLPRSSNTGM